MPIEQSLIKEKLLSAMPDAHIIITDLVNDQNHYRVEITSKSFNGLSMVKQHQLVYRILGDWVGNELHALSLVTKSTV